MPSTQIIRDRIGSADLAPVWRLLAEESDIAPDVDVTEQLTTAPGPAVVAREDLTTAPAYELTITTTDAPPFDVANPDTIRYHLRAGYRDQDGTIYDDPIGRYFIDRQETRDNETVTRFGSLEIQIIGMLNRAAGNNEFNNTLLAHANTVFTDSVYMNAKVAGYIDLVLRSTHPETWEAGVGLGTGDWEPETVDDFETDNGVDIWGSLVALSAASQRRLSPTRNGGWGRPAMNRAPGTPVATIRRDLLTDYTIDHAPRDRLPGVVVNYTRLLNGEEDRETFYTGTGTGIGRAESITLPGVNTRTKASAWGASRLGALNTLVKQHTFTMPLMPWIESDDTVTITAPAGDTDLMVSSLNYDLIAGTQTITAREII